MSCKYCIWAVSRRVGLCFDDVGADVNPASRRSSGASATVNSCEQEENTEPEAERDAAPETGGVMAAPSEAQPEKYRHHFRWESSVPERVSIKGSFDQWKSSLELIKQPSGKFAAPIELDFGSRVSYKYVVDGTWRHNPNEPTETDASGNVNNIFQVPQHPSFLVDPESESAQTLPNPAQNMSPGVLAEESVIGVSPGADLSNTPEPAESTTPPDMSIAFPSVSTDNVPELTPRPKQPGNKRTLSMFAPGGRFGRASHRTQSLATAPGTPTEKASPAGASVSNVVSAMAGVAATAIPAAIFAVTGKDFTRTNKTTTDSPGASPSAVDAASPPLADQPRATSQSPVNHPEQPSQDVVSPQASATPGEAPQPSHGITSPAPEPLAPMPVNDFTENPEPKDNQPEVPLATHQPLSSSAVASAGTEQTPPNLQVPIVAPTPGPQVPSPAAGTSTNPAAPAVEPTPQNPEPTIAKTETTIAKTEPTVAKTEPTVAKTEPTITKTETTFTKTEPTTATPANLPQEAAKPQVSTVSPDNAESPPKVSFSDDEAGAAPQVNPAVTEANGTSQSAPQVKISPQPTVSGATTPKKTTSDSLGPKSKMAEFSRKTSSWRYSVGSIRSRRASGEHGHRSVSDNPMVAKVQPLEPQPQEDPSPKLKRKSGLFQKIKCALSPHKKGDFSSTYGHGNKRNSLTRSTTINRD